MTSGQDKFPVTGSLFNFKQYGESRAWVSDLMPNVSKVVDELCFVKSMHTEAINHDPAITFFQTGSQLPGRPSIGSWMSYGLGSLNDNLPPLSFYCPPETENHNHNRYIHDCGVMDF